MSGPEAARLMLLVERAHPHRISRHADEWDRCARILDEAVARIDMIAARQSDIGGRTGPSMARAMALACDVLRVKSEDLQRGGRALHDVADATEVTQERKRAIDRDHPDDGQHVEVREMGSRQASDGQEASLLHAIQVMKSIRTGDDPRTPIHTDAPDPVVVRNPTFWPPDPRPEPPLDVSVDPDDDTPLQPHAAVAQGPAPHAGSGAPGGSVSSPGGGSSYGGSSSGAGSLTGAAVLGGVGVAGTAAVGRALGAAGSGGSTGSGGARIGGSTPSGSGGVLGRGAGGAGAGAGAGAAGGRGGRRRKDDEPGGDRDLHDDGEGWLDDEAGPDVLR